MIAEGRLRYGVLKGLDKLNQKLIAGISEEEIERTCAMHDDCSDCPLWDYCNEDEEVVS